MQISSLNIEEAANQFKLWRQSKTSKRESIPNHFKELIRQLLLHYSQKEIISHFNISRSKLFSIKKENSSYLSAQNMTFIPFQITTSESSSSGSTSSAPLQQNNSTYSTCHIIKPNGLKLIIQTSDPTSVIQAFLCSN